MPAEPEAAPRTEPQAESHGHRPEPLALAAAPPDKPDRRDRFHAPSNAARPERVAVEVYEALGLPVLDQGDEAACTGFALAAVIHFLLRFRRGAPDTTRVSPRMLYQMAKLSDRWAGDDYAGSSARGAVKGWAKHGVCTEALWPYAAHDADGSLTGRRARDAAKRRPGPYLRVRAREVALVQRALAEAGILYATTRIRRAAWRATRANGLIPAYATHDTTHAVALVGYDAEGFWVQNSKSVAWGRHGLGRIDYGSWAGGAQDVWMLSLPGPAAAGDGAA